MLPALSAHLRHEVVKIAMLKRQAKKFADSIAPSRISIAAVCVRFGCFPSV